MQTRNEKIAAKTGVVQDILCTLIDDFTEEDSLHFQHELIKAGYLIVEL